MIEHIALTRAWRGTQSEGSVSDLRRLTQEALRRSLPAPQLTAHDQEVRRILRQLCVRARDANLHAEDVIILLKETWRQLPETRRAVHDRDGILARAVTLCIEEYYSAPAMVSRTIDS